MPIKISSSDSTEDVNNALGDARSVVHDGKKSTIEIVDDQPTAGAAAPNGAETKPGDSAPPKKVEEGQEPPKKKTAVQRRIDKLAKRVGDAERRAEYWESETRRIQGQILRPAIDPKPGPTADDEPNPDNFEKHSDYLKAQAKWVFTQEKKAEETERKANEAKAKLIQADQDLSKEYRSLERDFIKAHPDFKERVEAVDDIRMPSWVQQEVLESGPELAYALAEDPEKFSELCALPERQAKKEIRKVQAKMLAAAPPPTPAPEPKPKPITPMRSNGTAVPLKDPSKMSIREYDAWRRQGNMEYWD